MSYIDTIFDPRFMFDANWKQRRDIIATSDEIEAMRDGASKRRSRVSPGRRTSNSSFALR